MKINTPTESGHMDYRDRESTKMENHGGARKELRGTESTKVGDEGLSRLRQHPGHTLYRFPSFLGRRKSRGRAARVTRVRDSDPQSMSPKRHSPRTRYHSKRFSFSLRDSLRVDVSSVTRDVMAPARGWGRETGVNEGLRGLGGTSSGPGCQREGVNMVF